MVMKFRAHETFFIRKGWLSKGMKAIKNDPMAFISKEKNPMDTLGIGSNMVKSLRYWLQAVGIAEEPNSGKRIQTFTPLGEQIYKHDRYIEELGTLYLLQYRLASQHELAASWYYFYNIFNMTEFTRDDFIAGLNGYVIEAKILPVVISGSSNSLAQAFLLALQRTLTENELTDIMPETNYQAAINTIEKWKSNFPETYARFEDLIDVHADEFIGRLADFNPSAYAEFEKLYPSLTAGSSFNPFVGFDVADLYEEVVKALKPKGYTGIYVIYDEFSKYLENHITDETKSDTKMLQDFAEKCGRSGKTQLHLMLISHKEITSYIERASKTMIDGWRGVSERFRHIYLNNNFTQTYEIIAAAIEKDKEKWDEFRKMHSAEFEAMKTLYGQQPLFSDSYEEEIGS